MTLHTEPYLVLQCPSVFYERKEKMKIKYIGPSFGVDSLTNGKIYEATEDNGMYRVIDDSGEDYLYSMENPAPADGSSPGGRWEIVEN